MKTYTHISRRLVASYEEPKNNMDFEEGSDDTSDENPSLTIAESDLELGEDFNGQENGETGTLYGSSNDLSSLITCFLKHNPSPSDAQVHALAAALNIDKETLEAQMYEMLSEYENENETEHTMASLRIWASSKIEALTEDEKVLDDDYDPNLTNTDSLILNDGNTDPEESEEVQEDLYDDGSVEPIDDDSEVIINDGVLLPPSL